MRKLVLLPLIVFVTLWSVGCRTVGREWNLPDEGKARIVDGYIGFSTRDGGRQEIYVVVLEYNGREADVRVSEKVFLETKDGDVVSIKLKAVAFIPEDRSVVCAHYQWEILDNKYHVDFKYPEEDKWFTPESAR